MPWTHSAGSPRVAYLQATPAEQFLTESDILFSIALLPRYYDAYDIIYDIYFSKTYIT